MNWKFWQKPTWNRAQISAFADHIEDHPETALAANIQYFAAAGFFMAAMRGGFNRQALANHLGLNYGQVTQMLFPVSEGLLPTEVRYGRPEVVAMLRNLARTGKVSWNG